MTLELIFLKDKRKILELTDTTNGKNLRASTTRQHSLPLPPPPRPTHPPVPGLCSLLCRNPRGHTGSGALSHQPGGPAAPPRGPHLPRRRSEPAHAGGCPHAPQTQQVKARPGFSVLPPTRVPCSWGAEPSACTPSSAPSSPASPCWVSLRLPPPSCAASRCQSPGPPPTLACRRLCPQAQDRGRTFSKPGRA